MKRLSALALAAAVYFGATACGSSGSSPTEPELEISVIEPSEKVALPHEYYFPSPEQELMIQRARDSLIKKCASRYGVDLKIPERELPPVDLVREYPFEKMYPRSVVQQWGFHLAPNDPLKPKTQSPEVEPPREEQIVSFALDQDTFNGKKLPEGGCSAEAERTLEEGDPNTEDDRLGEDLRASGIYGVKDDSRYKAMIGRWSECMRKEGYQYPDPNKMLFDLRWRLRDTGTPQLGEVEAATTDWDCRRKVNYTGFMVALHTAYQKRFIAENSQALQQHRTGVDILIKNAADALSGEND